MIHTVGGARRRIDAPEVVLKQAQEWATGRGVQVVLADARAVFGKDHLESAILHAERARAAGTMAARTVAMETLRYLSGQRQVADAIRTAGLRQGTGEIAFAVLGRSDTDEFLSAMGWTRADDVLSAVGKDLAILGVSRNAEESVPEGRRADLALECVALVDLTK